MSAAYPIHAHCSAFATSQAAIPERRASSLNEPTKLDTMARTLLLSFFFFVAFGMHGQTHFYIDQIAVSPTNPTTSDNVSIALIGNLSDGGAYIATAVADVGGGQVNITLVALSNGGVTVLVPHTEVLQLGQLPAGDYTIDFTDASVGFLDFAPPPQHTFTVSGGASPCDDLELVSVQWAAFSDTAVVVHVLNNSNELFDYPNFILFNADGDTLAKETVNFFGIGGESRHVLRVMDGVLMPEPFDGRLELWTGFTDSLACAWEDTFDLCPPAPCAELSPTIQVVGSSIVTGLFNWVLFDEDGLVANGQFELTPQVQYADTTLCVPPGNYDVNISPTDPGQAGISHYSVSAPGGQSTISVIVTTSLPVLLPFTFYGPCISGTQSIGEVSEPTLLTAPALGGFNVWLPEGGPLGPVWLFDAQGRLLFNTTATTDRLFVPTHAPGVYILRVDDRTVKVLGGME